MAAKRVLDKPKNAAAIIAWTVDGKTSREVVALLTKERKITVTPQAVQGFIRRHRAEISATAARVTAAVVDVTVRDKAERIRRLAAMVDRVEAELAGGKLRYYTADGDRIDAAAIAQFRGLLADVADELGDRPKTPLIDARTVNVFADLGAKIEAATEREPGA